ncbi:autotransporter outer membrane beta-barrel domain-containing protein [Helicobacter sp. 11S03491-1]|uniref:autotransporter outer membrane beta-barrel domain-containing protein n=1 Tax=Helicobacter sp. 11S03491-1 TaxID=1476196 RepID=UPI000BA6843B|nr:autotransporter outer membrane beta-barrel domain-containing protein [Helicobacter sp. 11S03491-1]PAF43743.1 hypothetical protein BKH45_00285 [Helicobacter sp. 11S03491-1]
MKKTDLSFSKILAIQVGVLLGIAQGVETPNTGFERVETRNLRENVSYNTIDGAKTRLINSSIAIQTGFRVDEKGNILFGTTGTSEKMFPQDEGSSSSILDRDFSSYEISKVYFQSLNTTDMKRLSAQYLFINNWDSITPVIAKSLSGFSGVCKNFECSFTDNKIEKEVFIGMGGKNIGELGFFVGTYQESGSPDSLGQVLSADTITTIGGTGDYAYGIRSIGIINANAMTAIGGNGIGSDGLYNEDHLIAGNIIAIGGKKGNGITNITNRSLLKSNNMTIIGGIEADTYGIFNSGGDINTNFLTVIAGKSSKAAGLYNQGKVTANGIIVLTTPDRGIGMINDNPGKIDVDELVIVGRGSYAALRAYKGSQLQAKNIYLQGYGIHNEGSIKTHHLFVNDFSTIRGGITLDTSEESSLVFNLLNKWEDFKEPYLTIKAGNLTLNSNTKVQVKISNETILKSNLSYDKTYELLSMREGGKLEDNRTNKTIEFSGLSASPKTRVDSNGIAFTFTDFSIPTQEPPLSEKPTDVLNEKSESLGISPSQIQNITDKISSISPEALLILTSMIEGNAKGSKFQEVAINEGLKNFNTNPNLLHSLIEQTDKTLQENTTNMGIFSQKTTEYLGQQVGFRIQGLAFDKKISKIKFTQIMRRYALASNSKNNIYLPDVRERNSAWIHAGGSYYRSSSTAAVPSNTSSFNLTIGYDRELISESQSSLILGGLFNYNSGVFSQDSHKEVFNSFSLGVYTNFTFLNHEIQSILSGNQLLSTQKISNQALMIDNDSYTNNSLAFNLTNFYKYKIVLNENHSVKPLILLNYSFMYTPSSSSKIFDLKESFENMLAAGVGGEYILHTDSMNHTFQALGRYHFLDIQKSRAIAFKGSNIFINYDLNPSKTWFRLSYNGKFWVNSSLSVDISLSGDMSIDRDLFGVGNIGLNYIW